MVYPLGNNSFNPDMPFGQNDKANVNNSYNNCIFDGLPDVRDEFDFEEMSRCYVGGGSGGGGNVNAYRRQHKQLLAKQQNAVPQRVQNNFSKETIALNSKQYSQSSAANVNMARKYLNKIVEVNSQSEYNRLSSADKRTTQMSIIGGIESTLNNGSKHKAQASDSWCALFISAINRDLGIKGWSNFCDVHQFVKKAKSEDRWHQMRSWPKPTKSAIKAQLSQMKPGYYIVFNGDKPDGNRRAHIGIIEFVDVKKGTVTIIEGNAKGAGGSKDKKDGVVRNVYSISDLINAGYGGYINTNGIK